MKFTIPYLIKQIVEQPSLKCYQSVFLIKVLNLGYFKDNETDIASQDSKFLESILDNCLPYL